MFFFIFVDGYMMFWILGLFNIPLAMYSSFEELTGIKVLGVRLFYKEGQVDVYQDGLVAVCIAAIITVQLLTFVLENVLPFVIQYYEHKGKRPWLATLTTRERFLHAIFDEAEREGFDVSPRLALCPYGLSGRHAHQVFHGTARSLGLLL